MRFFHLRRIRDLSGISGTGIVAEGVQFSDGSCSMRWLTKTPSTALYSCIEDLRLIHGHEGATVVEFDDEGLSATKPALEGS